MSKQSKAKEQQQYVSKAAPETCFACRHLKFDKVLVPGVFGRTYTKHKNIRCGIGGFAVKKLGTCRLWEPMDAL